jgi:hypothetical protein
MKLKILLSHILFFISLSLYSQTEYNVYRIEYGTLDKVTNTYKTVESLNVNTKAFLSKEIFKVEKKDSTYDIFNISSFSNNDATEKTTYKIIAFWKNENQKVIIMYIDIKGERKMYVFGPGYSITYYLNK